MNRQFFLLLAYFVFLSSLACGQSVQPRTAAPTPPSKLTRPESIQDSGLYNYWTHMTGQQRAGGALFGKLTVEGERVLWEPVLVTVDCKGKTVHTAQSDFAGNFAILGVKIPQSLSLQGDTKRQMETYLEGCTVQGVLTGFHSSAVRLTARNLRDDPELGSLTLTRERASRGSSVSDTTNSAPAKAIKQFEAAASAMMEQKPDRAERALKKAVGIYPSFAQAWYELGRLQLASSHQDAAASFAKAAAADPKYIPPLKQLSALAEQTGNWQEVLDRTNAALSLDPAGDMRLWYYSAVANLQLGKTGAAEASALKSLALDPLHNVPNTEQVLAVALAKEGDYSGALEHLRNCITYLPAGEGADLVKQQIAQLEKRLSVSK